MNSLLASFKESAFYKLVIAISVFLFSLISTAQVDKNSEIYKVLKANDSIIFDRAFNNCEVDKLELIIAEDIEFYHDIVGVQNREEFINAVKNNICTNPGTFTRKLVENSLEVHQLKNNGKVYGAIQNGKHDFYVKENNKNSQNRHCTIYTSLDFR